MDEEEIELDVRGVGLEGAGMLDEDAVLAAELPLPPSPPVRRKSYSSGRGRAYDGLLDRVGGGAGGKADKWEECE